MSKWEQVQERSQKDLSKARKELSKHKYEILVPVAIELVKELSNDPMILGGNKEKTPRFIQKEIEKKAKEENLPTGYLKASFIKQIDEDSPLAIYLHKI